MVNGITGVMPPGANREPLPWVLPIEETGLVLAHNSLESAQHIIKPNDPHVTGLMRFLGTFTPRSAARLRFCPRQAVDSGLSAGRNLTAQLPRLIFLLIFGAHDDATR